jgi:heme-degrading monooxygenase HmoA
MAFVSATRLRLRKWYFVPEFVVRAGLSLRQARRAEGCLGARVLNEAQRTFWTCTAWRDEPAMRAYMRAGAHAGAMTKLLDWCDEASVVHWTQGDAALPSWEEVHRRMQEDGRRSKVRYPSEAHRRFEIAPPRLR